MKYHELYAYKIDNLGEMGKFFERHRLSKFTQEERNNLNNPISIKDIEFVF